MAKLGKASQDAYNPAGWLFLQALLKNGVAEGVTSDSLDTNMYLCQRLFFHPFQQNLAQPAWPVDQDVPRSDPFGPKALSVSEVWNY